MSEQGDWQVKGKDDQFIVEQLLVEYQRRSDVLHKAVDNYYVVLGIGVSTIAALMFATGGKVEEQPLLLGAIPFALLALTSIDVQVRTTVYSNATYIAYLEKRINKLIDYPLLIWETALTPGQLFYYKRNRYTILRAMAQTSFIVLAAILFVFCVNSFLNFLDSREQFVFFSRSIESVTIRVIYLVTLGILSVISGLSWILNYTILKGFHEQYLNTTSDRIFNHYYSELEERKQGLPNNNEQ